MSFTVIYTPVAQDRLIELCVAHDATDLGAITAAANRIDALRRRDPASCREVLFDTVRKLTVPPLGVGSEIIEEHLKVNVLTVWHVDGQAPVDPSCRTANRRMSLAVLRGKHLRPSKNEIDSDIR
jgi:hypothetical protein